MPIPTEKEFNSIIEYAGKHLLQNGFIECCSYEEWKGWYKPTRKKKETVGKYAEEWNKFWALWPNMRTFEYKGKKFVCNKPFKASEEKLYAKYIAILEDKKEAITAEQLYNCAYKALLNCKIESYRRGKNEMEFHSGLEPWLNQKQWRNWMHVEMPQEVENNTPMFTEA